MTETRAEKVARIRAVQAQHPDWTRRQVASELSMKLATLHNLLNDPDGSKQAARRVRYQRPCPECGSPMTGSEGLGPNAPELCAACDLAARHSVWTRDTIASAMRRWAALHGHAPTATEWLRAGVWVDADGEFRTPAATTTYGPGRPFAAWSEAKRFAGFEPDSRGIGRTGATARIRAVVADGAVHSWSELSRAAASSGPSATGIISALLGRGELVRVGYGCYQAGPNLRPPSPIPQDTSHSPTAALTRAA